MPNELQELEWKCGQCGFWVGNAWYRHCHVETIQPTFEEMHAARAAGTPMEIGARVTTYQRTGNEDMRVKPL